MEVVLNNYHQKRMALINDITGFGRCSATVEIPVISALKVQCCLIPTSILSNHTGYPSFYFDDYTDRMEKYIDEWKRLNLSFDGISTGFLGSAEQINIVKDFIKQFKSNDTTVIVDPVMGDNGRVYQTYTDEMCRLMKELVGLADIITPNITEACILTDIPYHDKWHKNELEELAERLMETGPGRIVITGIQQGSYIANYCCETDSDGFFIKTMCSGRQRSGTGDIFASIISADAVNGTDFKTSVRKASSFIKKCIQKSDELDIPIKDGVCFEELLTTLR